MFKLQKPIKPFFKASPFWNLPTYKIFCHLGYPFRPDQFFKESMGQQLCGRSFYSAEMKFYR